MSAAWMVAAVIVWVLGVIVSIIVFSDPVKSGPNQTPAWVKMAAAVWVLTPFVFCLLKITELSL